jgi:polyribonucleotide nucleotidyltransferase
LIALSPATPFPPSVKIATVYEPALFGVKGANIKDIQDKSNTKIEVDKATETYTVRGTQEAIDKAQQLINQLLIECFGEGGIPIAGTTYAFPAWFCCGYSRYGRT